MRVRTKININAPPARIFRLLDDPANRKKWLAGLQETTQTCGTPGQKGSEFVERIDNGNGPREFHSTILNTDFPRQLQIRQTTPSLAVTSQWTLEASGDVTRVVYVADMAARTFMLKLMSIFTRTVVKRIMVKQLNRVKMLAENRG